MPDSEHILFGEIMLSQGLLTEEQLQTALAKQGQNGRKLGRIIAEAGFASEETVARTLARQLRISFFDLRAFTPKPEITHKLPEAAARRFRALALGIRNDALVVGLADPTDKAAIEEISRIVQLEVAPVVIMESDLLAHLNQLYLKVGDTAQAAAGAAGNPEAKPDEHLFDLFASLPTPVAAETLYQKLLDHVNIDPDKLDTLIKCLLDRQTVRIGSEVTQDVADKICAEYQNAGVRIEKRESLQLIEVVETATVKTVQCPACGMEFPESSGMQCPSCGLIVAQIRGESEQQRKQRLEEEERARVQMENEKRQKSNEEFLKQEEERKLREEARAKVQSQQTIDLRTQQEAELRKQEKKRRTLQWSAGAVVALTLLVAGGRWLLLQRNPPADMVNTGAAAIDPHAAKNAAATAAVALPEFKPANRAGKLELLQGNVQILDRHRKPKNLRTDDYINEGDRIVTGTDGEVHLRLRDEGFMAVRPNSELQINTYRAQGDASDLADIHLQHGGFRTVTGWIGKFQPDAYRVQTPSGTITAQSAELEPLVLPAGSTAGEAGTYLRAIAGTSQIETAQGRTEVPVGKTAFAALPGKDGQIPPTSLLSSAPAAYKATPNEAAINGRYKTIQKTIDQQRDERRKKVAEYCRKE